MEKKKSKDNKKTIIIAVVAVVILLAILLPLLLGKGSGSKNDSKKNKEQEEEIVGTNIGTDDVRFFPTYVQMRDVTYDVERPEGYESFSGKEMMSIISPDLNPVDFTQEGDLYSIDIEKILMYLRLYFPAKVGIKAEDAVDPNYVYTTNMDFPGGKGMVITAYEEGRFKVRFTALPEKVESGAKIFPRTIESAVLADSKDLIAVKEKVIYVDSEEKDGKLIYTVYADAKKKQKLDTKEFTVAEASEQVISAVNYTDKANTITHKFQLNKDDDIFVFVGTKFSK